MIILTTSRRPTPTVRALCRFFEKTIPGVIKISRGKSSTGNLLDQALQLKAKRIVVIERSKGGPSRIRCFLVDDGELSPSAPTLYLGGARIIKERFTPVTCVSYEDGPSAEVKKSAEGLARLFDLNISIDRESVRTGPALHVSPHGTHGAKASVASEKGYGESFVIIDRTVM